MLNVVPARAGSLENFLLPTAVGVPGRRLLGVDYVVDRVAGARHEGEPRLVALERGVDVHELALVVWQELVGEAVQDPNRDLRTLNVAARVGFLGLIGAVLDAEEYRREDLPGALDQKSLRRGGRIVVISEARLEQVILFSE